jgi:CheY-like chemotaxis protein
MTASEKPSLYASTSKESVDRVFLQQAGAPVIYPDAEPGDYVRLRIRDNGTGIQPDVMPRIFDAYVTTKEPYSMATGVGHIGFGLTLVRDIVVDHHGFIVVDSKVGAGTTIDVYLPMVSSSESAPSQPEIIASVPFSPADEVLLLVDDEELMLKLWKRVLGREGFKDIITATNGLSALQVFRERSDISIVATDVQMPQMSGDKLVPELRKLRPDLPIFIVTGDPDSPFKDDPTIGFLQKPFDIWGFYAALRRHVEYVRGVSSVQDPEE